MRKKYLADLVDSLRRVSDVPNTYGGGEFDGCEGRIRPFLDDTLECVQNPSCYKKRDWLTQAAN